RDGDADNLTFDSLSIIDGQSAGSTPTRAGAASAGTAGEDQDDILSHAGDLGFNLRFGAVSNADHGNHSADSDDHAKHREQGAELVPAQRARGNLKGGEDANHMARLTACWASRSR